LLIGANDGYAGMSGPALKYIALGQVRQFRKLLPPSIQIDGVGGVTTGRDVLDMERAGAARVQIASAFFTSLDPGVIQRIVTDYAALCDV
jgi:dihydroorotate dehydrogenase (fumarate)